MEKSYTGGRFPRNESGPFHSPLNSADSIKIVRLSLERKISIGFAVAVGVLLLTGVSAWWSTVRFNETFQSVSHTHQVLYRIESGLADLLNMQTAVRGFLLTHDENFLGPHKAGLSRVSASAAEMRKLIVDNPGQGERFQQAQTVGRELTQLMAQLIAKGRAKPPLPPEHALLLRGDALMAQMRTILKEMENEENRLLAVRTERAQRQATLTLGITIFFVTLASALVIAAGLMVRREIARQAQSEKRIGQLNTELHANNARLETTNRELEAFSYSVSHDLRAPLRHITGFASLLERKAGATLDPQSTHYLNTIIQSGVRMGLLIDDLLAFSRTGRSSLKPMQVDQREVVERIVGELKFTGAVPKWTISALPSVNADGAMLRQVWFNLLDNAVKYSGKNPAPAIEIGHRFDEALNEDVFWVRDNGVGFDMAYADKLFGVFSRLHSADEFEGTGIGLALVRRIISRHGGRTWAEGSLGEGATIYFSLPRRFNPPSP